MREKELEKEVMKAQLEIEKRKLAEAISSTRAKLNDLKKNIEKLERRMSSTKSILREIERKEKELEKKIKRAKLYIQKQT